MALRVENLLCVNCSLSCLIPTEPAIPLGNSGANLATGFTQEFQVLVTGAAELKGRSTAEPQPVPFSLPTPSLCGAGAEHSRGQ